MVIIKNKRVRRALDMIRQDGFNEESFNKAITQTGLNKSTLRKYIKKLDLDPNKENIESCEPLVAQRSVNTEDSAGLIHALNSESKRHFKEI